MPDRKLVNTIEPRLTAATSTRLINIAQHQAAWFSCVLGAAWGYPWQGAGLAFAIHSLHVLSLPKRTSHIRLIIFCLAIGALTDSLNRTFGVLGFTAHPFGNFVAPVWIMVLWAGFGTILPYSFSWLSKRYGLAALVGCFGGPLSFFAGYRMGALNFPIGVTPALLTIAGVWAAVLPTLVFAADTLTEHDRYSYRFLKTKEHTQKTAETFP